MAVEPGRPRVLHLITRFVGGGAERTLEDVLDALQASETAYDLRVGFGPAHDDEQVRRLTDRGVETVVFSRLRHYGPLSLLAAVGQVARYLRRQEIDLLHTHSTEAGIVGRFAAALTDTPVIHHVHGHPVTRDRSRFLNALVVALERTAGRFTTRFIVVSETLRDTYVERGIGSRDRYTVVYPGVDTERFRTATPLG